MNKHRPVGTHSNKEINLIIASRRRGLELHQSSIPVPVAVPLLRLSKSETETALHGEHSSVIAGSFLSLSLAPLTEVRRPCYLRASASYGPLYQALPASREARRGRRGTGSDYSPQMADQ